MRTTVKILLTATLGLAAGYVIFCATRSGESRLTAVPEDKKETDASKRSNKQLESRHAIDAHTHLSKDAYELLPRLMEEVNVERVVNLSGGRTPRERKANIKNASRSAPQVAHFFNVSWRGVNQPGFAKRVAREMERAVHRGIAGLKIHKALGLSIKDSNGDLLPVDTPRLDPIWEKAGELGIPVTIHTADPKAFFKELDKSNERYQELKLNPSWSFHGPEYPSRKKLLNQRDRLIERHADTTFILAHFGNNPENIDYVDKLMENHSNILLDTSARIGEIGRHPASEVRQFFIKYADRILFGTDLGVQVRKRDGKMYYSLMLGSISKSPPELKDIPPFYDDHWRFFESDKEKIEHPIPIQGDWKVHPIDLPREVLEKLYWKNAERVIFATHFGRQSAYRVIETAKTYPR